MNETSSLTLMKNTRVDQVGSLLRPSELKDAYARHGEGKASDEELARAQDESVRRLIAKQEALGFPILSDGEHRRLKFQDSFVESVAGFVPKKQTLQFQESRTDGGDALQRWQPDSAKTDPRAAILAAEAQARRDPESRCRRLGRLNKYFSPRAK